MFSEKENAAHSDVPQTKPGEISRPTLTTGKHTKQQQQQKPQHDSSKATHHDSSKAAQHDHQKYQNSSTTELKDNKVSKIMDESFKCYY